ncbi:MAG: hypothetical protein V4736_10855 [Bdellovibrionota bacterium]
MNVLVVLAIIFVLVTAAFLVLAFFLPEWVGIQGKKAREIQRSHHDSNPTINQADENLVNQEASALSVPVTPMDDGDDSPPTMGDEGSPS